MPPGPDPQRVETRVEKRVFYRLQTELPIRFRIVCGGRTVANGEGSVVNLSPGGMLLNARSFADAVLADLFSRATHLVVELPVARGTVATDAYLVWVEGPQGDETRQRYGFEFRGMTVADQHHLEDWIVTACP